MFKESITAEELAVLPLKTFEGDIVLVQNLNMVRIATQYLNQFKVLGFDTETKPTFKKGQFHGVALLQLATDERTFLFRIQKIGIPDELKKLLGNPAILKAGIAIHDDIKGLQKVASFIPNGFVELQNYAQKAGIQNIGLKKLCAIVCGFRISKSQQLSNWESDELTGQQMIYAATDAWVSLKIYQQFTHHSS